MIFFSILYFIYSVYFITITFSSPSADLTTILNSFTDNNVLKCHNLPKMTMIKFNCQKIQNILVKPDNGLIHLFIHLFMPLNNRIPFHRRDLYYPRADEADYRSRGIHFRSTVCPKRGIHTDNSSHSI